MPSAFKHLWPLGLVFLINFLLLFALEGIFRKYNVDGLVLHVANILFLLISVIAWAFQFKALKNKNPNVFIRSVMGSMMVKMFICVIAVFIYVTASGGQYNKKAILISMLMYLIYLAAEVVSLMKLNRRQHG
ncbi:MAG: hypothetical protein ABIT96_09235 [Ferruginibacter sp.]